MKSVFICLLFAATLTSTFGLDCYDCIYWSKTPNVGTESCKDQFDPESSKLTSCNAANFTSGKTSGTGIFNTSIASMAQKMFADLSRKSNGRARDVSTCVKLKGEKNGDEIIWRSCILLPDTEDKCEYGSEPGIEGQVCACHSDKCNSTKSLSALAIVTFLTFILSYLAV